MQLFAPDMVLRDYQVDCADKLRASIRAGFRRIILCLPTGGGKTPVASHIIRLACEKAAAEQKTPRVLFLAPRIELVRQASEKLWTFGVPHGVIMRGTELETMSGVQVASKDTLESWAFKRGKIEKPPADLLIVDEAHLSMASKFLTILRSAEYSRAVQIGLTATPARGDGRGLGDHWQTIVGATTYATLIDRGYLIKPKVYAPYVPKKVRLSGEDDLGEAALDKPKLVGDVVQHWLDLAKGRPTICFASSVKHSMALRDEFVSRGVRAVHVDYKTDQDTRSKAIESLTWGDIDVLCNVKILGYGTDIPAASCAILAMITNSFVDYRQAVGRIERPFPVFPFKCRCGELLFSAQCGSCGLTHKQKEGAIVLDHGGNVLRLGLPCEDVEYTLETGKELNERVKQMVRDKPPIRCPKCTFAYTGTNKCPQCGYVVEPRGRPKATVPGQLLEVQEELWKRPELREERQSFWDKCLARCAWTGKTAAAAAYIFKQKFGEFPKFPMKRLPAPGNWRLPIADLFPEFARRVLKGRSGGANAGASAG